MRSSPQYVSTRTTGVRSICRVTTASTISTISMATVSRSCVKISSPRKRVTNPRSHSSSPSSACFSTVSSKYARRSRGVGPLVQISLCWQLRVESPVSWLRTAMYPSRLMKIGGPMILEKPQIRRTSSSVGVSSVLLKWKTWCAGFQNLAAAHRRWWLTSTSAAFSSLVGMPHRRSFSQSSLVSLPIHSRRVSEQCGGVTRVGKPIAQTVECRQMATVESSGTCYQDCRSSNFIHAHNH